MHGKSPYETAHLLVAAIRICTHQKNGTPPEISDISSLLKISAEEILILIRQMEKIGVLECLDQAGTSRYFIQDMQVLETLPKQREEKAIQAEIESFKNSRQKKNMEIENFQKKQKEKQKELFSQLNRKLKSDETR
ncbi:hypothetical protein LZ24_02178 [Desulfobotulus alkaliphilus]|uniref:Uncharacterized protein n=1 Tax=Desulfobotulus alkaliphilus TaxID=622671 RepID=A0A562RNV5_9BACT|nr:hypothetical protein [Desulfobotulus alkaliphilus]TWI70758.1 hypothetical protein LZ24_02178 [Desulfobotulus alkaliphilus]